MSMRNNYSFNRNYHLRSFSVVIAFVIEYMVAKYIFRATEVYRLRVIFGGLFLHSVIDIFFIKDIITMAGNYNAYYSKYLFYVFAILVIGAFAGCLVFLNNQIGHVS
jgi:hypothetical protein